MREIECEISSASLEVHLLAASVKVAKSVDVLDGSVAPDTYPDWLLIPWAVLLTDHVRRNIHVSKIVVAIGGQKKKVFGRAIDDVLVGHAGCCVCNDAEVATGPGDECVCHLDRWFSAPAMR
jgi:hypothetical protein